VLLARQVGVPYIVVALTNAMRWMIRVADCGTGSQGTAESYKFRADDVPVIRLVGAGALNGEPSGEADDALMEAVDKSIPQPARELDKPF